MTALGRTLVVALVGLALPRPAAPTDTTFPARAAQAAEVYRDVRAAVADGYVGDVHDLGPTHLVRLDRVLHPGDGADAARPSALLFDHDADGFHLRAAVFLLADADQRPPASVATTLAWHRHRLCVGRRGVTPSDGAPCPAGDTTIRSGLMAHVWVAGGETAVVCAVDR